MKAVAPKTLPRDEVATAESKPQATQWQLYGRLLKYIKPYWVPFVVGMLAALPSGGMDAAIAWLAGRGLQWIFIEGNQGLIYYVPLVVLAIAALQGFFRFLEAFTVRYVGGAAIRDLRNQVFQHIEKQPLIFFQSQSSGILIGRMINDIGIIENAISQTFQSMISRTITLISLVAVLLLQSWKLSLIAVAILSLIVIPVSIFGKKIRKSSRSSQENVGDLVAVISESIQGAKVVQSFNLQGFQIDRFMKTNQAFFANTTKAIRHEAMLSPILAMIGAIGIAAVIWVAGYQVTHHQMTVGSLTSFVIALLLLYSPIKNIGRINGVIQPALAAANRVFDVLDRQAELTDLPGARELPPGSHSIAFKNVFFHYPTVGDDRAPQMVLRDISFDIPAGRMVALVGLSGSGKSTMIHLIPRFYDVTAGEVQIDGSAVRDFTLASLRDQIAMVTQDNFLFNTTIQENIALGKLGATRAEIEEAAKAAYCHDFIQEFPAGYQTVIGERGIRLSGGQQQRLSIARAFLKNAPVIILDEATSSLDNESEAMVQSALNKLMEGRTVIVIAHRLSTVRHADQIIVLENGSIVESGSHDELSAADGSYSRLLAAQFERPRSV